MRRRRVDLLNEDLKDALKAESKGLLGTIIRLFLAKIVDIIINALIKKNWVNIDEDNL